MISQEAKIQCKIIYIKNFIYQYKYITYFSFIIIIIKNINNNLAIYKTFYKKICLFINHHQNHR